MADGAAAVMSTPTEGVRSPAFRKTALLTRSLAGLLLAMFGAMTSFYLLLSAVPRYITDLGGTSVDAGLSTGALLLFTVLAELATPTLIARLGRPRLFGLGLFMMGAPSLLPLVYPGVASALAACALRGVGFGALVVVGGASVTSLLPPSRRGEGLGLYGIVVGVPAIVALPLGVWAATELGYAVVFVIAALAALPGLVTVPHIVGADRTRSGGQLGAVVRAGLAAPGLRRPALAFSLGACSVGTAVTFLPLAAADASGVVPLALFIHSVLAAGSRWWAGRRSDRSGVHAGLSEGVLLCVGGLGMLSLEGPSASVAGMALLGAGFGLAQSASLGRMLDAAPATEEGHDMVSSVWNVAYDTGMGLGSVAFGLMGALVGYAAGFAVLATLALAALALLWAAGKPQEGGASC